LSELLPTDTRERLVVLDVLRGLALLGVLLGNSFRLYSGMFVGGLGPSYRLTSLDVVAAWFINLIVQSKAQTLLTFLFGFGFAAQLLRGRERGQPVVGLYVRRMLALAAFGALHIALLWWGDVLWTYAVAGFWLLAFLRVSNRTRLIAAGLLIFIPGAIMSVPGMHERASALLYPPDAWKIYSERLLAAIRGSDHAAVLWEQIRFFPLFSAGGIYSYEPWLVGRFLLGYVVGAKGWFARDGADHLPAFRRILYVGLAFGAIGLTMNVLGMLGITRGGGPRGGEPSAARSIALTFCREFDYLGLAAVYLAGTVLLFQRPGARRLLRLLAPAGRMPLTVYLSQSLIMTGLLYGWGLGWGDDLAPAGYIPLCFAVFAAQVLGCHLWLRRFRFGPLEWAWRALVYLRPPPMRVSAEP
jgi:uncharacterized protein